MRKFCGLPMQNNNVFLEILKAIGSSQDQINPLFEPLARHVSDRLLISIGPRFEWYVVRCGSKNGFQKDTCSKEIGLHAGQ